MHKGGGVGEALGLPTRGMGEANTRRSVIRHEARGRHGIDQAVSINRVQGIGFGDSL